MALRPFDRFAAFRSILCSGLTDRRLAAALVLGMGLWAGPAAAHITMLSPAARYSSDMQKAPPCGHPDNPPGAGPVATYQAGETITVQFEETVNHPGHFRLALDMTGTDTFTLPTGFDDFYNSPEVILDDIPDMAGGVYSVDVTLPDTPCDPCTLQLIQVMDDGSWGPGDSDLYFNCADIVIEGSGAGSGGTGTGGNGTGGSGGDGTTGDSGPSGEVGSGGDAGSGGGSTGGGSEGTGGGGTADGASTGSSGPSDSEDDKGGCSCRAEAGGSGPASAAPWLLVALLAWRRRRA
jgi:MYXO-CTERM domain-containing protein